MIETPALAAERPPRLRHLAVDMIILIAVPILASLLVGVIRLFQSGLTMAQIQALDDAGRIALIGIPGIIAIIALQSLAFAGVPILRTRLGWRAPLARIGLVAERPLRLIFVGVGIGILVLTSNIVLGLMFAQLGIRQNQSAQYPLVRGDYIGQLLFFIGAAIVVPFAEELLFRGYLFLTLRRMGIVRGWPRAIAFIVSALLFGLAHSIAATQGQIALVSVTSAMGLILAWAADRTGSIIPGVIAHACNNGVALLALIACINSPGLCPSPP